MSSEITKSHSEKFGLKDRIREFEVSSATVELAAQVMGYEPARVAKTLSFLVDGRAVPIMTAGGAKVSNPRYKSESHTKARMLALDKVTELVGHSVGGICPFDVKEGVRVFLDESLKRFEIVYPACGSANSVVRLIVTELEQCSGFEGWIDVCKAWREEEQQ